MALKGPCPSPFAACSQQSEVHYCTVSRKTKEVVTLKDECNLINALHRRLMCLRNPWVRSTNQQECTTTLEQLLLSLPSPQQLPVRDLLCIAQLHLTMSSSLNPLLDSALGVRLPCTWMSKEMLGELAAKLELQLVDAKAWLTVNNITDLQLFHLRRAQQLANAYKELCPQANGQGCSQPPRGSLGQPLRTRSACCFAAELSEL